MNFSFASLNPVYATHYNITIVNLPVLPVQATLFNITTKPTLHLPCTFFLQYQRIIFCCVPGLLSFLANNI